MLKGRLFAKKLNQTFVDAGVSGTIHDHHEEGNALAIKKMLEGDGYYDFGIKAVRQAKGWDEAKATAVMADSLGIDVSRFRQNGPGFINPELTIERLARMLDLVDAAIADGQTILLATGHPGSMLQFYVRLAGYIERHHGRLYELPHSLKLEPNYWVDSVSGVLMASDLGSLMHTHDFKPMAAVLKPLKAKPGLAVSDHGFAGAAINAGTKTVALHDVDDPGIPAAAALGADVLCVPMNDNQLNLKTDRALAALMDAR